MKKNVIWKILIYFIVYSIAGFLIETVYAIFTKGTFESRQSFLYGPFCIVYGIGAIALIFTLNKYKDNTTKLFLYGMIVGCIVEYFSSYIGELLMNIKWWDYSNDFLDIHGRTCLYYALWWGGLSIPLIKYINPFIDTCIGKIYNNVSPNFFKFAVFAITLFMAIDGLISYYALDVFLARVSREYNIEIAGVEEKIENNNITPKLFSNEKIMMTYPNMIVVDGDGELVLLENVLSDVKNYYYKFGKSK